MSGACCCDPPNAAIEMRRPPAPVCSEFSGVCVSIPSISPIGCPTSGGWPTFCRCTEEAPQFPARTVTLNGSGNASVGPSLAYTSSGGVSMCYSYSITCNHDGSGNTTGFTLSISSAGYIGSCGAGAPICGTGKDYTITGTSPFGTYTRSGASSGWAPATIDLSECP